MKLYARPGSFRAQKVLVASQYAGKSVTVVTDAKEKDLKGKAPADRLPLLETDKGCLFESNAIMRFLASDKPELVGKDAFESAEINSWMDFCTNEIEVPAQCVSYPVIGWMDNVPEVSAKALKDLTSALSVLEEHLKLRTFLVGRSITLADISIAAALVLPMKLSLGDKERKSLTCVTRWFNTCVNQEKFVKVIGPVTVCKKPTKPKAAAKSAAPKKVEKPAAPEPAPAPEKPKDPLAALPKSSFVLDSWKRQYSNAPGGDYYKSMDWLWENFDAEGWSIHKSVYNYNEECKIVFQTSNLCGGFMQRSDAVRKYLFGVIDILGTESQQEVHGMWLIRGQDMQPLIDANPDAEYHTFTKMELTEENKKIIADCWCAESKLYGKDILDSKVFK
eukprot:CAMPEP_0171472784 /NCGR_PEP_ID=MMETSP0946-20130122/1473_1 /TAXON_ID=109269 /ORGANISM="Vaucheria litorea, Strain CCMP2940" /LENGTH=390 /DNA_ID=CAMNT_0012002465 /DNA_START=53 /DNA_END=1225 /DNA_ORIENTATION=-